MEPEADDSAIALTVPATASVPTALIVTSAGWPTLRFGTSPSENAAVTVIAQDVRRFGPTLAADVDAFRRRFNHFNHVALPL